MKTARRRDFTPSYHIDEVVLTSPSMPNKSESINSNVLGKT